MTDPFSTKGKAEMRRLIQTMKVEPVPIIMPRWMLYLFYAMFAILGVTLAVFGSVSVMSSTPAGYILPYGAAIFFTSVIALFGAITTRHEASPRVRRALLELIPVSGLFSLLSVYIASTVLPWAQGDFAKGSLGVVVTISSLIAFMRTIERGVYVIRKLVAK